MDYYPPKMKVAGSHGTSILFCKRYTSPKNNTSRKAVSLSLSVSWVTCWLNYIKGGFHFTLLPTTPTKIHPWISHGGTTNSISTKTTKTTRRLIQQKPDGIRPSVPHLKALSHKGGLNVSIHRGRWMVWCDLYPDLEILVEKSSDFGNAQNMRKIHWYRFKFTIQNNFQETVSWIKNYKGKKEDIHKTFAYPKNSWPLNPVVAIFWGPQNTPDAIPYRFTPVILI